MLVTAQQQSPAEAKKAIQARYDLWSKAYMRGDAETLISMLMPEYTLTSSDKEVTPYSTYCTYLRLKQKTGGFETYKTSTKIKSLKLKNEMAEVIAIETMESIAEKPGSKSKTLSLHSHEYRDIWVSQNTVWKLSSTVTIKESTKTQLIRN